MDTPPKKNTQKNETPTSKSKLEDSPVLNYMDSLSPIRPVRSILNPHRISPLNSDSPLPVLPSPRPNIEWTSEFFKTQNSPSSPVESREDESTFNEEVVAAVEDTKDASVEEEASTVVMELPKDIKYDCSGTNPDTSVASPCGRDTTDLSLVPYSPNQGEIGSSEGAGMQLQNMYDIVEGNNQTPDWKKMFSDASELLIFNSPNDSEAFTTSEARVGTGVGMQTMQPDSNNEPESSDTIPNEGVSQVHRGIRRCLDFEIPGNKQTLSENNTAVYESSSRWVLPSIGIHLNPIVMSRKGRKIKLISRMDESCKRCNCKMSKCLKLYCECFSAVVYCTETCSCVDCFNKPIHEDIVLATRKQTESRNPLAFAPKFTRSSVPDSPVFNFMNSLSVRSILNPHTSSSLNFDSPLPILPSRFFKTQNSLSSPVESREEESTFNEYVAAAVEDTKDASVEEEASTVVMELPKDIKYVCSGTNPDTSVASPCGKDATDLSLVAYAPNQGEIGSSEGAGMQLQNMYDNVEGNNQTLDSKNMFSDASGVAMQTMQPDSNNEPQSSDAIPYEGVSLFHRGIRRCLAFEMPGNKQILSEYNTAVSESSSRCVLPSVGIHLNPIAMSSKKKRVKSCKRCNCKKSKCLKLYCDCFAAVAYCTETCSCVDCFNKPMHEDIVLDSRKQIESRDPLAFAPKVVRSSDSAVESGDDSNKTPASARHKRGCNCRKSDCRKNYCQCYQSGVGCSINCRCEGCKNKFGRRDG